jgi:uncharacterized membrane protein
MNNTIIIAVTAVICIAIITVVAVSVGHNSALIAASISTISGLAGGIAAYNASKTKYPDWHNERVKKEEQDNKGGE